MDAPNGNEPLYDPEEVLKLVRDKLATFIAMKKYMWDDISNYIKMYHSHGVVFTVCRAHIVDYRED